jgi:predicted transcriptional regulator
MKTLKEIILKKTIEKGISISALERKVGIGKNYIYYIFKKNDCPISTLRKIVDVLEMEKEVSKFFITGKMKEDRSCKDELVRCYKKIASLSLRISELTLKAKGQKSPNNSKGI